MLKIFDLYKMNTRFCEFYIGIFSCFIILLPVLVYDISWDSIIDYYYILTWLSWVVFFRIVFYVPFFTRERLVKIMLFILLVYSCLVLFRNWKQGRMCARFIANIIYVTNLFICLVAVKPTPKICKSQKPSGKKRLVY